VSTPTPVAEGTAFDFRKPLDVGAHVWIVGWKRREELGDSIATHRRVVVSARIGGLTEDGLWTLSGVPEDDYAGVSGGAVVQIADGQPLVVGMYCGYVASRWRFLGIGGPECRSYVFIRPEVRR
jgi:hypothetical protein